MAGNVRTGEVRVTSEKIRQMLLRDSFEFVIYVIKILTTNRDNNNLRQFSIIFEEEIAGELADQFDQILLRYIHYVLDDPSKYDRGHVNKALYALQLYIF